MSGGPAFLRDELELTTRFCYVNFDGTTALCKSREQGLDVPIDDQFVHQYCTPVYDGIKVCVTCRVWMLWLVLIVKFSNLKFVKINGSVLLFYFF